VNTPKKRGRPPRTFVSSGDTKMTLRELGIPRHRVANAIAIASLPEDVFEAELARTDVKPSERRCVNLARGLPANHRRENPLTEAVRAAQKLSSDERVSLFIAVLSEDEMLQAVERMARLAEGRT